MQLALQRMFLTKAGDTQFTLIFLSLNSIANVLAKDFAIISKWLKLASGTSRFMSLSNSSKIIVILLSVTETGIPFIVTLSLVNSSKEKPAFSNSACIGFTNSNGYIYFIFLLDVNKVQI